MVCRKAHTLLNAGKGSKTYRKNQLAGKENNWLLPM